MFSFVLKPSKGNEKLCSEAAEKNPADISSITLDPGR